MELIPPASAEEIFLDEPLTPQPMTLRKRKLLEPPPKESRSCQMRLRSDSESEPDPVNPSQQNLRIQEPFRKCLRKVKIQLTDCMKAFNFIGQLDYANVSFKLNPGNTIELITTRLDAAEPTPSTSQQQQLKERDSLRSEVDRLKKDVDNLKNKLLSKFS